MTFFKRAKYYIKCVPLRASQLSRVRGSDYDESRSPGRYPKTLDSLSVFSYN